jgi:hypothetical protein
MGFYHIKITPIFATPATLIHLLVQNWICLQLGFESGFTGFLGL